MLGGGNPVGGSNPSGIGSSLNYIGKHAFATSGLIVSSTDTVLLDFTTASGSYVVATFEPVYGTDSGDNATFEVKVDDQVVYRIFLTAASTTSVNVGPSILLPPQSRIVVTGSVANNRELGAVIVGEVYA